MGFGPLVPSRQVTERQRSWGSSWTSVRTEPGHVHARYSDDLPFESLSGPALRRRATTVG